MKIKTLIIPLFLINSILALSQDTLNPYDTNNVKGYYFGPLVMQYEGEYQIRLNSFYWLWEPEYLPTYFKISYSYECVSFPFIPECFDINVNNPSCTSTDLSRNFVVLQDSLKDTIADPYPGYGWIGAGKKVFQISFPHEFLSGNHMFSYPTSLASFTYAQELYAENRMVLPHSILRINLNVHDSTSIESPILIKISWLYDNTRGRMSYYPFINHNQGTTIHQVYDVIFRPDIVFDNSHYYNTAGNGNWFQGVCPSFLEPSGSINYFNAEDVPNNFPFHPGVGSTEPFPATTANNFYFYPAPFTLLSPQLRNNNFTAFAGYDDNGQISSGVQQGLPHTYEIDKTIDLNLINPSEKIIYNPSKVEVNCDLTFPEHYKFLTVHGKYPDKSWVEYNNVNGYEDLRDVLCPSDQLDAEGNFLSEYTINDTLTISKFVTIMDANFTGAGIIQYHPEYIDGNFRLSAGLNLVILSDTLVIDDPQVTWVNPTTFTGHYLMIESGSTLTIQNSLKMYPESRILVKRGGTLIIDGATLTGEEMWPGIEVWGTKTEPPSNYSAHGTVVMDNGATIENAICGIRTIKMDDDQSEDEQPNYNYSGGRVIIRNDSRIRNCVYGVYFFPYDFDNASRLTDVVFETTDLLMTATGLPAAHIFLNQVYGVEIRGCTFRNTVGSGIVHPDERGMGIYSFNSGFLVTPYCTQAISPCPSAYRQPNRFEKLYYGIRAFNSGSVRTFTVDSAEFANNVRAVYIGAVDYATVIRSKFELGVSFYDARGIYLDECTGYTIEENEFLQDGGASLGIIVNNSGEGLNEIYRNVFTEIQFGILAQNHNRNYDGTGLQIKCNTFTGNNFDIAVTHDGGLFADKRTGIAANQGSLDTLASAPAGNRFSWTGPLGTSTDINNQAPHITYYYHAAAPSFFQLQPQYFSISTVTPQANLFALWDPEASCPSNIDTTIGGGNTDEELRGMINTYSRKADSVGQLINSLEDAGNTTALKWEVEMSAPSQSLEVYNELMYTSPYISDSVMASAIAKETVLVDAMIRDVMVASPESAKNDELLKKLGERSNPLPDYMLGQILQGRSLVSVYGDLMAKQSFYRQQQAKALRRLKQRFLNDTVNPIAGLDSLLVLLENEETKQAVYERAFLYGQVGAWSAGIGILNSIPQQFNLQDEDLAEHENLLEYYNFLSEMNSGIPDSFMIAALYDVLAQPGKGSVYARNHLSTLGLIAYEEPVIYPDMLKSAQAENVYSGLIKQAKDHRYIEVFPIPANDYIIVKWEIEKEAKNMMVRVTNLSGQPVLDIEVMGKRGQQVVKTGKLKSGIYLLSLYVNNKVLDSEKITITH